MFTWVHSGATRSGREPLGSRGFTRALLGVVGVILVRVGSLGFTMVSSVSFVFAWVHSGARRGCRVHWS